MIPLDETSSIAPSANENTLEKRELWWLMGMLALGTVLVIVYNAHITIGTGLPVSQFAQYAQYALVVALIVGSPFGAHLSNRVGLPISPALKRYLGGQRVAEALLIQFGRGFVLGLAVLVLILTEQAIAGKLLRFPHSLGLAMTPKNSGRAWFVFSIFLTSIGAPLFEEITLRVFCFSFLAWVFGRAWQKPDRGQAPGTLWAANVGQAIIAGLGHVLVGGTGLPFGSWYVQVLMSPQTWGSFALGCIYWRYGLEGSIFTHFWGNFIGNIGPVVWLISHHDL